MKINKIVITNFRGKNYEMEPDKLNLFLAPNGTGKTTLVDAIRYGLTGELPADKPVGMNVRMEFDGLTIERGKKADGTSICKVNDNAVTVKALDQAIEDELMAAPENIRISSSTEALMDMKPEKFSEFIIKQIPEKLNFDMIMGWFANADDKITKTCKNLLPDDEFTVSAIDEAYAKAFAKRKEMKAELAEATGAYNSNTAKQPEKTVEEIQAEEKKLAEEYAAQSVLMKQKAEYEAAKKKRAEQDAQMEELSKKAAGLKDVVPTDDMQEKITLVTDKHRTAEKMLREQLASLAKDIQYFEKVLTNLSKPICPIHPDLRCTTDKTAVKDEIEKYLAEKQKAETNAKANLKKTEDMLAKCAENQKRYDACVKKYAELQKVNAQIEMLKKNLVTVPDMPKENAVMTEEQYRNKVAALDAAKIAIEKWNQKLALQKKLKQLTEGVRILDAIVKAFAPKGAVKMQIVQYYFDILEAECDTLSAKFGKGYKVKLTANDGIQIMVQTPKNGNMYPMNALSGGERATAMFIVMATLNQLSNSGIMFFDNVEILDKTALENLKNMITDDEFLSTFDHLFICGVDHEEIKNVFKYTDAAEITVK